MPSFQVARSQVGNSRSATTRPGNDHFWLTKGKYKDKHSKNIKEENLIKIRTTICSMQKTISKSNRRKFYGARIFSGIEQNGVILHSWLAVKKWLKAIILPAKLQIGVLHVFFTRPCRSSLHPTATLKVRMWCMCCPSDLYSTRNPRWNSSV